MSLRSSLVNEHWISSQNVHKRPAYLQDSQSKIRVLFRVMNFFRTHQMWHTCTVVYRSSDITGVPCHLSLSRRNKRRWRKTDIMTWKFGQWYHYQYKIGLLRLRFPSPARRCPDVHLGRIVSLFCQGSLRVVYQIDESTFVAGSSELAPQSRCGSFSVGKRAQVSKLPYTSTGVRLFVREREVTK